MFIHKFHIGTGILWSVIVAYILIVYYDSETIEIETPFGRIRGYESRSRDSRQFWMFKGIPYAKPPIGTLRFQAPVRYGSWNGTFDAKYFATPCLQYDSFLKKHDGREDCLQLNVFTPNIPKGKDSGSLYPCMIYVHGGSFIYGSGALYGPEYFMDEDIVLVTVHYRLGILGFLNTGDDTIMGNMGLKDLTEALKWVQEGIQSFGGDPSKVTVFGESAGGAAVHYLMLSNQTKGLFHGAISQSGTALSPWAFARNPGEQAVRVGNKLGCPRGSSEELLSCLQKLDAFKFADFHRTEREFWSETYGPSVENPKLPENRKTAFLREPPLKLASEGNYEKRPWILGVNSHEGCILGSVVMDHLKLINTDWNNVYPLLFMDIEDKVERVRILKSIRHKYFGEDKVSFSENDLTKFTDLFTAWHFTVPLVNSAKYHQSNSSVPLYLYYFDYPGRTDGTEISIGHIVRASHLPIVPLEVSLAVEIARVWLMDFFKFPTVSYGVCHADELKYYFKQNPLLHVGKSSENYMFSKEVVRSWANFAKTGVPDKKWQLPASPDTIGGNLRFYEFSGLSSAMMESPFDEKEQFFWRQL